MGLAALGFELVEGLWEQVLEMRRMSIKMGEVVIRVPKPILFIGKRGVA